VKRYRDDKRAQDADTMTQVRSVYTAHAARGERPVATSATFEV